jgi:hypothetical protein
VWKVLFPVSSISVVYIIFLVSNFKPAAKVNEFKVFEMFGCFKKQFSATNKNTGILGYPSRYACASQ